MKRIKMRTNIILGVIALLILSSCKKQLSLEPLSFYVQTDSSAYTKGSVTTFKFSGKPDNISFYSGEPGKRYEYRDRITADGVPQLMFSTALNAGVQPNTLSLMLSTDFAGGANGKLDSATIVSATWTDISNRVTWATGTTATSSGLINLSDLAAVGKPVYIAFKYKAATGSIQNKWTITGLSLRNVLSDGTSYVLDSLPTLLTVSNYGVGTTLPGWGGKTILNNGYSWTLNASSMVIAGATSAATAINPTEAWAITGPINLKKVTPDAGIVLQNMAEYVPSFKYTYAKTGNYEAVFVASNANIDQVNKIEKKLSITIR